MKLYFSKRDVIMPSARKKGSSTSKVRGLAKCQTGIPGLDQLTSGGLPRGRTTLVCGGPGAGKTLLGLEFLIKGASVYNEPGVFISFEENAEDLAENVASLGVDLDSMIDGKQLVIDHINVEPSEIEEAERIHRRLVERALAMDGTSTGEHGVGMGKRSFMEAEHGDAVAVMRAIKAALDPEGLMNPGKIL